MRSSCRARLLISSVALSVLIAAQAHGQSATAPADSATSSNDQSGEIVVTAQKRSENLSKVPASISVLGGGALGATGIASIEDLTRAVPGVSFMASGAGSGAGEGNSVIEFRGISSQGAEATVGLYLDETSITNSNRNVGATQPVALDIARVEVLRGPQGTLYGASSEGGTIRFIHNLPDLEHTSGYIDGTGSGTAHGGGNYEGSAVINLPLVTDVLAVRIGALSGYDSGWIDHYDLSGNLARKGVNSSLRDALRLAARYTPNPDLTIDAEVNWQRYINNDSPVFFLSNSGSPPYMTTGGLFMQSKEVPDTSRDKMLTGSVTINYKLGAVDITSVSSVYNRSMHQTTDATFYDSAIMATAYFPALPSGNYSQNIATLPSPQVNPNDFHTLSQELRFASPDGANDKIRWVGGVFVSSQRTDVIVSDPLPGLPALFEQEYGYPLTNLNTYLGAPASADNGYWSNLFDDHQHTHTLQIAGFGQVDLTPVPRLHLSAGLRYQYTRQNYYAWGSGFFYIGIPATYAETTDAHNTTPKFTVSYDVDSRSTVYATAAEGFRIGGPTGPLPTGAGNVCQVDYDAFHITTPPSNFTQDKLWSYEAGTKLQTADHAISLNAAGYFINWHNLQQSVTLPTCGFIFASNVGDAHSYGGELELHVKVPYVKGLRLNVAGAVTDATLTKVIVPFASVGEHVLSVPDVTGTASADYSVASGGAIDASLHAEYAYTGQSHGSFITTATNYVNNSYGVVNATLALSHEAWTLTVFARNLLDDRTIIQQPTVNSVVEGFTVTPRTVGASIRRIF